MLVAQSRWLPQYADAIEAARARLASEPSLARGDSVGAVRLKTRFGGRIAGGRKLMRFVIYGAGGIGGTIGARLHQAGFEVCLIARGEHVRAIQRNGLRFVSPTQDVFLDIPCADHPRTAEITPDDAVILCMKGQHTEGALRDLYAATGGEAHVICCQNGVDNERLALRRFPHTYGMVVWLPAEHLEPGRGREFRRTLGRRPRCRLLPRRCGRFHHRGRRRAYQRRI